VTGGADSDQVETYHDRIRESIMAHLGSAEAADHHRRLARALEATGRADPEAMAIHFLGAGEFEKGGTYYVAAAVQAAEALAFDRAATLYALALELLPPGSPDQLRLRVELGNALANAGRGAEAAREYLAAAGATINDALDLKRRAAMQFLISGHVDDGLGVLRDVLAAVGARLAPSPRRALLSLLAHRVLLHLRGIGFRQRSPGQLPADIIQAVDIYWSVTLGLSMIDPVRAADFEVRHLLLALRAGEPYRVALALALELAHVSVAGYRARARTAQLREALDAVVAGVDNPHALGLSFLTKGVAEYMQGKWKAAIALLSQAEAIFRERCTGVIWELDTARAFHLYSLFYLGEIAELSRRVPRFVQEAQARGNLYALATLGTFVRPCVRLAADDVEGARRELDELMSQWSRQGYHLQHSQWMIENVDFHLYQGNPDAAVQCLTEHWPALTKSLLLRTQHLRTIIIHLHARCMLAASEISSDPRPLLRSAERDARQLWGERTLCAQSLAQMVRAGLAARRGDRSAAATHLASAAGGFDAADMALFANVARRRLGEFLGGDEGQSLVRQANSWMASQQIQNPARMTDLYVPGAPRLARHP
jgi:tetratricopeptide (TPR) repeat protein